MLPVSLGCFYAGKSNPYCEVSMGSQSYTTRTLQDTLNPKWNFNCQFFIKDLYQDVLCLTMFDRDQFSPDGKYNLAWRPKSIPSFLGSGVCTQGPKLCIYPMTPTGNDMGPCQPTLAGDGCLGEAMASEHRHYLHTEGMVDLNSKQAAVMGQRMSTHKRRSYSFSARKLSES